MNVSIYRHRRHLNYLMLLKVTGWLLMIEGFFMAVPAVVAYCYAEDSWLTQSILAGITWFVGTAMQLIRTTDTRMGRREGFLLTGTVWLWFSAFGMMPFIFCEGYSFSEAFFEAISCYTTTGVTASVKAQTLPHSLVLWKAMMQWIGGMGIILFTLAVLPMLNSSGGMQMFNAEVTGITHDKVRPRISSTAKALWTVYISLTIVLAAILWLGPMDMFESICYGLTTMSTGGYSPPWAPPSAFDSIYVYVALTVFMLLGGIPFSLIVLAFSGKIKALIKNEQSRVYLGWVIALVLVFVIVTVARSGLDSALRESVLYPVFQVVNTVTTTGYDTPVRLTWSPLLAGLTVIMMVVGACAGSTAGGVKIDRLILLISHLRNEVVRCVRPNAVLSVRINGRVIPADLVSKTVAFICLFGVVAAIAALMLMLMGLDVTDSMYTTLSCMSNIHYSPEVTGYGLNLLHIPDAAKWILAAVMLIGRLEIYTILILLTRSFWLR